MVNTKVEENHTLTKKVAMNVVAIKHNIKDTSSVLEFNSGKKNYQSFLFKSKIARYLFASRLLNVHGDFSRENFESS